MLRPENDNPVVRLTWRHPRFWGIVLFVAASMLAVGPDGWMEWLFWAASVRSLLAVRVAVGCLAVALGLVIAWPLLSNGRRR